VEDGGEEVATSSCNPGMSGSKVSHPDQGRHN
jgi:hypothetical protein